MEAVFGDPEVMRYGDGPQDAAWTRGWIDREMARAPGRGVWAVTLQGSGEVIGYCGYFDFPDIDGRAEVEIGYRLSRAHWGRGYATEAATAVRDHALRERRLTRIVCLIDPANASSVRVAEKLGMTYEKNVMLEGYTHPDHLYVLNVEA